MGGLAAAARLSVGRDDVTGLEQADEVGGKLGWFERDGFGFDTGPSLLTLPAVYRDLFLKTGDRLEDVVDLVAVDPAVRYRFADGTWLEMPNAARGQPTSALDAPLGPGTGRQWADLLDRASRMWDVTRGPFLESPLGGMRGLVRQSRRVRDVATVAPWQSLRGLGRQYLHDERLRTMLDRYATYTGSDPRRAPAALATVPYVEQSFGAWYVRGGLRRLGDALHQRVLDAGATVRTEADVAEVVVEGGRVTGVRLVDGERLPADVVVANADAAHVYGDLVRVPAASRARRALARTTPSLSGFVLLLALRGRTPGLRHHTVLFPSDYDDEFDSVFGTGAHAGRPRAVPDPAVYVSAPDDPALRPDEHHEAWFLLVNAPRHSPDDPRQGIDWDAPGLAASYADQVLDVL